ncbi:MAG TPA: hypothetical protein VHC97_09270 [Thermoanaerobaculia bacterium]|nr:hypothetical protein [Thermoanaerobaculia bacterium]
MADRFGKFAVAWIVHATTGTTTRLRIFDSAGVPTGPEMIAAGPEGSPTPASAAFSCGGSRGRKCPVPSRECLVPSPECRVSGRK